MLGFCFVLRIFFTLNEDFNFKIGCCSPMVCELIIYATFKISRIGSVGSANCEPADSSSQSFHCCFLGNVFDVHSGMNLFLNMCSYYYYYY